MEPIDPMMALKSGRMKKEENFTKVFELSCILIILLKVHKLSISPFNLLI
jgi:hypothetical protein